MLSPKALIVLLAAATAPALFSTVQAAAYPSYPGEPIPWEGLAGYTSILFVVCPQRTPLLCSARTKDFDTTCRFGLLRRQGRSFIRRAP